MENGAMSCSLGGFTCRFCFNWKTGKRLHFILNQVWRVYRAEQGSQIGKSFPVVEGKNPEGQVQHGDFASVDDSGIRSGDKTRIHRF